MKLYRVEWADTLKGPKSRDEKPMDLSHWSGLLNPWQERVGWVMQDTLYCASQSWRQFEEWFPQHCRALAPDGLRFRVFEVPKEACLIGRYQVVFQRLEYEPIEDHPLALAACKHSRSCY